jgi:CHAD domain-containing protein
MPQTDQTDHAVESAAADGAVALSSEDVERFEPPHVGPDDPAASAVHAALAEGLHWLKVNAPKARAGDPEGVHHLRTTTRRIRTALALFRDLTDPDWADRLAEEFKWLARLLGEVRDLDVLTERLRGDAEGGSDGQIVGALAPLFDALRGRHDAASEALRRALEEPRFERLSGELAEASDHAPLAEAAWRPCREALPPLVLATWKPLKRAGRALDPAAPADEFHEVRKAAKRARYAAEAVRPALDPDAARAAGKFARRAKEVQDVLGAHQDAVVAAAEIRRAAESHPDLGPLNFAAGRLLEREATAAADARARFFLVWGDLDRKKNVRWLSQ